MEKTHDEKVDRNEEKPIVKLGTRLIMRGWARILIIIGATSILFSIFFVSQILAFIGLGLLFWGIILLYIQPGEYTKKVLLDAVTPPTIETLNEMINTLDYRGNAFYLPPKYLNDPEANKVFLPKQSEDTPPQPNRILKQENQIFLKNPKGILFTPPGAQLAKLFEKRLGTTFTQTNLQHFKQNLPKLFIEDLEIAEDVEIEIKSSKSSTQKSGTNYGTIHISVTNSTFEHKSEKNSRISHIYNTIGSPITSALACALTKVTGQPLTILDTQSSENGKAFEVTYQIENLEYTETPESPSAKEVEYVEEAEVQLAEILEDFIPSITISRFMGLSFIILGVITLIWMGQVIWSDINVWNKDIGLILFGSRIGENISLGMGVKIIHYIIFGLILLATGALTYLKKTKKIVETFLHPPYLPGLVCLLLLVIGFLTLIWVGDLALYEMIVWNKDLGFIIFNYGTDKSIGLGIGMQIIHYFIIGFSLLLSGSMLFIRRYNMLQKLSPSSF